MRTTAFNKRSNTFFENRKSVFIVAFVFFVLNFILRGVWITKNPLGGDEPFSLYHAQMSPSVIFSELTKGNNPPLFEILLYYWIKLGGISIEWTRLLSLIFSAATAFFLYLFATTIKKGLFPIFVSLIYAFSSYHLQFAHEIRGYSLFGLLTVISMLVFLKVWRDQKGLKWWIALLFVNSLLIYTHYFGFFLLFIQTILVLIEKENRKENLKRYSIYVLSMIVVYLPLIPAILNNFVFNNNSSGMTWLQPPSSAVELYNMLWRFSNKPVVTVVGITILIAGIVKFILKKKKKISRESKLLIVWFTVSFFGMFLLSYKIPMFLDRYLIYVSFAYLILLVYTIWYLFPKEKTVVFISGVLVLLFGFTFSLYVPNNSNAILIDKIVKEAKNEGYSVVICPNSYIPNFTYYYHRDWFEITDTAPLYGEIIEHLAEDKIYFAWHVDEVKGKFQVHKKWLYIDVASYLTAPNNQIKERLSERYTLENKQDLGKNTTAYYFGVATK